MIYYSTDVTRLSDAELASLMEEILSAGILEAEGSGDYPQDSWEYQAYERYYEMETECRRRWDLANPEEAARRRASYERLRPMMDAQIAAMRERLPGLFKRSRMISDMLRDGAKIEMGTFRIPFSKNGSQ